MVNGVVGSNILMRGYGALAEVTVKDVNEQAGGELCQAQQQQQY